MKYNFVRKLLADIVPTQIRIYSKLIGIPIYKNIYITYFINIY